MKWPNYRLRPSFYSCSLFVYQKMVLEIKSTYYLRLLRRTTSANSKEEYGKTWTSEAGQMCSITNAGTNVWISWPWERSSSIRHVWNRRHLQTYICNDGYSHYGWKKHSKYNLHQRDDAWFSWWAKPNVTEKSNDLTAIEHLPNKHINGKKMEKYSIKIWWSIW